MCLKKLFLFPFYPTTLFYSTALVWAVISLGVGIETGYSEEITPSASKNIAPAIETNSAVSQPAPSVFFPERSYEFPPVLDGAMVNHAFSIQNKGTAELEVIKVKTG